MRLQAALNGPRQAGEHPFLPLTPAQIAHAAQQAIAAGADGLHIHVRNAELRESLQPADLELILGAVRAIYPGMPIGISTGAWIEGDVARRYECVQQWRALPDYVSLNMDEDGAEELGELLLARGVAIEAGLATAEAAALFVRSSLAQRCLRMLLEPGESELSDARATVRLIEQLLDVAGIHTPRLLHGGEATTWPLLADAVAQKYATRIGLEDCLLLPDGQLATDNAALVRAACGMIAA